MRKQGILLLGHGSRRGVANAGLQMLAGLVQGNLGMRVVPAFFQFGQPSLAEGLAQLVQEGVRKVIILPAFLFPGVHLEKDIPEEVASLKAQYGEEVQMTIAPCLGPDPRLAEILEERMRAMGDFNNCNNPQRTGDADLVNPLEITGRSRALIAGFFGIKEFQRRFPGDVGEVVCRVVHATGNPNSAYLLRFHPQALAAGVAALRRGVLLFVDVRMVKMGIDRRALRELGGKAVCFTHHSRVRAAARSQGLTRALVAVRLFRDLLKDNIVVIGNAPTALAEVLRQVAQGVKPALIIGTPVGFVGASEAKTQLANQDVPYVTMVGPQGGSTVAVAIVNALLALARGRAGL